MDTENKVIALLQELSGLEEIQETDFLQENLALDSLGMVLLLLNLEDAFDIELAESDMNPYDLVTAGDVIALAEKYIGGCHEKES